MGRIIDIGDTPAKRRRAHERSCAEVLRMLASRNGYDDEARDMLAFVVFSLRGIGRTIEESAQAWDDRNYWKKAEGLREKYRWTQLRSDELEATMRAGRWEKIPDLLIALVPYFQDIKVTKITRDADWWVGAYRSLMRAAETSDSRTRQE